MSVSTFGTLTLASSLRRTLLSLAIPEAQTVYPLRVALEMSSRLNGRPMFLAFVVGFSITPSALVVYFSGGRPAAVQLVSRITTSAPVAGTFGVSVERPL